MRRLLLPALLLVLIAPVRASGQAPKQTLDVFLDCQARNCDSGHIRNELGWVNWVRDRTVADVHVLVTSQGTGSGGTEYRLAYIGGGTFRGDSTTLRLIAQQNDTDAERRDGLTARMAQGLMRYAVHTGAATALRIAEIEGNDDQPGRSAPTTPADDPWNAWVFSVGFDGSIQGEVRETEVEGSIEVGASRITRDWKLEIEADGEYSRNRFELSDGTFVSVTNDWGVDAFIARSVAALWSAGIEMTAGSSTFQNQDLRVRIAPAVEYSFYPYEQFSRRQLTLRYSVGANHWNYIEQTLYGEFTERRWDHELAFDLDFQQPWGQANAGLSGSHYLHDPSKYRLSVNGGIDIRLVRGLSLDLSAGYSRVHDQLYVEREEDLTDEEVLLRLRALQTSYEYDTRIGLRYTFGSVYNNIVNPRLDRSWERR